MSHSRNHDEATLLIYPQSQQPSPGFRGRLGKVPAYLKASKCRYGPPLFAALATGSNDVVKLFLETEVTIQHSPSRLCKRYKEYLQRPGGYCGFKRNYEFPSSGSQNRVVSELAEANESELLAFLVEAGMLPSKHVIPRSFLYIHG